MNRPSDVNEGIKLTQKYLSAAVKSHEKPDGTASQFTLPGLDAHVTINACYIGGSGQHRAWKYIYFLTINGRKFGGHDRRDSFVSWAINKIKEVAAGETGISAGGDTGVSGSTDGRADEHKSDGQGADEGRSNRANDSEAIVRQTGRDCGCVKDSQLPNLKHYQLQVPTSGYQGPSADSQISTYHTSRGGNSNGLHVTQGTAPESDRHSASSALDGTQERNGCVAQMDMPHTDAVRPGDVSSASSALTDGVIFDERLALALDEGQNSSNAWRLHDHINHGLDVLVKRVEGVLIREKVVEPELAEVGQ